MDTNNSCQHVNGISFVNIYPFVSFRLATRKKKGWDGSNIGLVIK